MSASPPISAVSGAIRTLLGGATGPAATVLVIRSEQLATGVLAPPTLALLLYGVAVNPAARSLGPRGQAAEGSPPLDLRYLVTAHGADALGEQDLLGAAMRSLQETPVVPLADGSQLQVAIEDVPVELLVDLFRALRCPLRPAIPLLARSSG